MLDSFIYSLNIIAPIFIIVALGAILMKLKFLNADFLEVCDRLVFKICLPCLLFVDIATAQTGDILNVKLIVFCVAAVTASFLIPCVLVPLLVKDNAKRGAFIQGVYRSNAAILGMTLAKNMFGDDGTATLAMILPFIVTLFNVFAVVILSVYAPADAKLSPAALAKRIVKTVATNPLIISIVLALVWRLTGLSMPVALISLGANFRLESLHGRVGLAVASSVCKTVIVPALAVFAAMALGFTGTSLGCVFIVFGGPAAVSSYIMAKQMKSDHELASQILLISTLMSLFTMFAGIFILRTAGLI